MRIHIIEKNTKVPEKTKQDIESKLMQFAEYIDRDKPVQIKIEEVKLDYRMEILFCFNGMYIKADVKDKSIKRALNRACHKIEKKLDRITYKQSLQFSKEYGKISNSINHYSDEFVEEEKITRRKSFFIKPMTEDEALLQMELLGHEFFMFFNAESETMCLLYKRKDGHYGIIESLNR